MVGRRDPEDVRPRLPRRRATGRPRRRCRSGRRGARRRARTRRRPVPSSTIAIAPSATARRTFATARAGERPVSIVRTVSEVVRRRRRAIADRVHLGRGEPRAVLDRPAEVRRARERGVDDDQEVLASRSCLPPPQAASSGTSEREQGECGARSGEVSTMRPPSSDDDAVGDALDDAEVVLDDEDRPALGCAAPRAGRRCAARPPATLRPTARRRAASSRRSPRRSAPSAAAARRPAARTPACPAAMPAPLEARARGGRERRFLRARLRRREQRAHEARRGGGAAPKQQAVLERGERGEHRGRLQRARDAVVRRSCPRRDAPRRRAGAAPSSCPSRSGRRAR